MITPPRRSVTRFFIPLIDVLILLFAIFLLMPFVSGPGAIEPSDAKTPPKEPLPENVRELQRELAEARDRIARMEKATLTRVQEQLDKLPVLRISGADGSLYYHDPTAPDGRHTIRTATDALKLIEQLRLAAPSVGGVKRIELVMILPDPPTGYPTKQQLETYEGWFKKVEGVALTIK